MDKVYVGLDLSLSSTGVSIIRGDKHKTFSIQTKPNLDLYERIEIIRKGVMKEIKGDKNNILVAIESPSFCSSSSSMHKLMYLNGTIRHSLHCKGLQWIEVPPKTLKKFATQHGSATKELMAITLKSRYGIELKNDDEVDAYFLARYAIYSNKG